MITGVVQRGILSGRNRCLARGKSVPSVCAVCQSHCFGPGVLLIFRASKTCSLCSLETVGSYSCSVTMGVYEMLNWGVPAIFILLHLHLIHVVDLKGDQVCALICYFLFHANVNLFSGVRLCGVLQWSWQSDSSVSGGCVTFTLLGTSDCAFVCSCL